MPTVKDRMNTCAAPGSVARLLHTALLDMSLVCERTMFDFKIRAHDFKMVGV